MTEDRTVGEQKKVICKYVSSRVSKLQGMYLSESGRSVAARQLAVLRRAATQEPGCNPETWLAVFDGMPKSLVGSGQSPSKGERAAHIALTLYAIHQQSQGEGMHREGSKYDIGAAARRYAMINKGSANMEDGKLPRHFAAMSTAGSIGEVAHHARQLIHLLRANSIPIDYGRLASQLFAFQVPVLRDGVRLEWGRAFALEIEELAQRTNTGKEQFQREDH